MWPKENSLGKCRKRKRNISRYLLFCRYKYTDDQLQEVIERAESLKSYNRDKKRPETDKARMPIDHYGLNLAEVDPVTEAYIMAAALETELLRQELNHVRILNSL